VPALRVGIDASQPRYECETGYLLAAFANKGHHTGSHHLLLVYSITDGGWGLIVTFKGLFGRMTGLVLRAFATGPEVFFYT
jgi:hypothetical protein